MNRNAFCGYQSIPFHCFLQSGAELELGRDRWERQGDEWGWWGVYSSIKTTVKVVVTTEQRGDSPDQDLLVSSTLLSTEDRARVFVCYAPVHVPMCSVSVPKHIPSCYWQSALCLFRWHVSVVEMKILPAMTTPLPRMEHEHTVRIALPCNWLWQISPAIHVVCIQS